MTSLVGYQSPVTLCRLAVLMLVLVAVVTPGEGRARLIEPTMRSSLWRLGEIDIPMNYLDELLNCGGFYEQWQNADGRCGACGDAYHDAIKQNEYPGIYSKQAPIKTIVLGQKLNVTVYSRSNLLGYFEFRLCPHQDGPSGPNLEACFSMYPPLVIDETNSTRYYTGNGREYFDMHLRMPDGLTCDVCVLQWKYHTGYRSGSDYPGCGSCLGCGPQEEFVNCADIRIRDRNSDGNDNGQRTGDNGQGDSNSDNGHGQGQTSNTQGPIINQHGQDSSTNGHIINAHGYIRNTHGHIVNAHGHGGRSVHGGRTISMNVSSTDNIRVNVNRNIESSVHPTLLYAYPSVLPRAPLHGGTTGYEKHSNRHSHPHSDPLSQYQPHPRIHPLSKYYSYYLYPMPTPRVTSKTTKPSTHTISTPTPQLTATAATTVTTKTTTTTAISSISTTRTRASAATKTTTTTQPTTTTSTTTTTTTAGAAATATNMQPCNEHHHNIICGPVKSQQAMRGRFRYCALYCRPGSCPTNICECFCQYPDDRKIRFPQKSVTTWSFPVKRMCYVGTGDWRRVPGIALWCQTNCPSSNCKQVCVRTMCS